MNLAETTVGPLLLGIFLNTYLYGIVSFQYASYYNSVFNDTLWIRLMVFLLFCLDTFHSVSLMYLAWAYTMQDVRNIPMYLLKPFWPYASSAFVTTVTACLTQVYLADRILRTKRSVSLYILVLFLSACAFVAGIVFAVKACLFKIENTALHASLDTLLIVWCSLEMCVDILISGILLHSLAQSRTGFQRSDKVINRLMQTTIQSGLLCSIASILILVLFVAYQETQFCSIFGVAIGRLYTNTLMDTLRCRKKLREMLTFPGDSKDLMIKRGNKSFELYVRKEILTDVHVDDLDLSSPKSLDNLNTETASTSRETLPEPRDGEPAVFVF
ncbi:hypothetical protein K443DRAFT_515706 [Laccaria amethystina LaAM-08-1]|uniref:DUF6534 domain-containing protein n=1 Tax=Laccaria amethystina LaAM-08-1 TaxID=1095629 RepID=A0A0C9WTW8_9AGAR|nr:hypothetical protein K443DRAFT_515706 [Laccaria amethystina LaAM-08-1]